MNIQTFIFVAVSALAIGLVISLQTVDPMRDQIFDLGRPDSDKEPYFANDTPTEYVGFVGGSITFNCHVKDAGNKTLSWVRHSDVNLLATGRLVFTLDGRVEVGHDKFSEHWNLTIRKLACNDTGVYECQIALEQPKSFRFYLRVANPRLQIVEGVELTVTEHDYLNLTCILEDPAIIPTTVHWSRNGTLLNDGLIRNSMRLTIEIGIITTSRLIIYDMRKEDSGWYACTPVDSESRSIFVDVVKSNRTKNCIGKTTEANHMLIVLAPLLLIFLHWYIPFEC